MENLTMEDVRLLLRLVERDIDANLESKKMANYMHEMVVRVGVKAPDIDEALAKGHKIADDARKKMEEVRVKLISYQKMNYYRQYEKLFY